MDKFSDTELLDELVRRLEERDRAMDGLKSLNRRLEELNAKLLESEKLKSNFLSNIRNEINNPLTSVLTLCDILSSGEVLPDSVSFKSLVGTIYKEAFSLNYQMRNIFMAADMEAGECPVKSCEADIRYLLGNVIESFRHRTREKRLSVTLEMPGSEDAFTFRTDAGKMERIMTNLLSNAIEFSTNGGTVTIKAWRQDGELHIVVTDNGVGMGEEEQARIFERFRQLDTGPAKVHGGHGLGLSIVKAALDLLGGKVDVSSRKGEGAAFTVTVPELPETDETEGISSGEQVFFFEAETSERF